MTVGVGDVEIKLMSKKTGDIETVVLKPTFRAAKMISRSAGGYMGASQRVMNMEFDTYVMIIGAGLNLSENGMIGLDERVYQSGLTELAAPLVKFIRVLANGGKPPKDAGQVEGDEGEAPLD